MSSLQFRLLLAVAVGCGVLSALMDTLIPSLVPSELSRAVDSLLPPAGLSPLALGLVACVWGAAWLVGLVGMALFKAWGRAVFLATTIAEFLFYPLFGPAVSSWLAQALTDATSLMFGAALAIAYLSPLRARFGSRGGA